MIQTLNSRLRVPATMAVGGSAIAAASLVGNGWKSGLLVEIVTVAATIGYYVIGGRDTDIGAVMGSRPDERQATIGMRSAALTGNVLSWVAVGGFVVVTATGGELWPFALFCGVGGLTFVTGLMVYRHRD